jgi:hypothetical protein
MQIGPVLNTGYPLPPLLKGSCKALRSYPGPIMRVIVTLCQRRLGGTRMFRIIALIAVGLVAGLSSASAWDGTDTESGASVEIEGGNLVREGNEIQVYDHEAGEYRDVTVESIERSGSSVEVEVYDSDAGEYRTLEMED